MLKKTLQVLLIALAVGITTPTFAQSFNIAVLDAQEIINNSDAAKEAIKDIDKLRNQSQEMINEMEADLNKKREAYESKQSVLSEDKLMAEQSKLKSEVRTYQVQVQNMQEQISNQVMMHRKEIIEAMRKVVSDIAAEEGYDLVVEKNQLLYNNAGLDITDTVMEQVNARLAK